MADNYLENQYEQYRARKAAWEKAKKSGKAQTLHKPTLPLKKGGKYDKKCSLPEVQGVLAKPL